MTPRNLDWVDASPVKSILRSVYWALPVAYLSQPSFDLLVEAHPKLFEHPIHPSLAQVGVLGVLFGKLIFLKKI